MNLYELKQALAAEAKVKGICSEWYDFMMVSATTAMMAGMESIINNRYPADYVFYCEDGGKDREPKELRFWDCHRK